MIALPARRVAIALLAAGAFGLGACGGDGGDDPAAAGQPDSDQGAGTSLLSTTTSGPSTALDQSTFCTSIRGIQGLGGDAGGAVPEQVLAQNEEMLGLLDEAQASVPEGAPSDVASLIDDYRKIGEAIGAAGGDVNAAYAAIQGSDPNLAARLVDASAHLAAFQFFADRCGVTLQQ
jgi:hypothetical protein